VQQHARGAELGQLARLLDQRVGLVRVARAKDEPASRRFSTSFSGSCRRKTSIPLSAAEATKRLTNSPPTGRDPTRKRPRSAIASGVSVRSFSARIRSHGLSTPRRTAVSKTPPPETSR
jgi:hypothetical protein